MKRIEEIEVAKIHYMQTKSYMERNENVTQADEATLQSDIKKLQRALEKYGRSTSSLAWDMPAKYLKIADAWKTEAPDKSDKRTKLDRKILLGNGITLEPGSSSDTTLMTIPIRSMNSELAGMMFSNKKCKKTPPDSFPF